MAESQIQIGGIREASEEFARQQKKVRNLGKRIMDESRLR